MSVGTDGAALPRLTFGFGPAARSSVRRQVDSKRAIYRPPGLRAIRPRRILVLPKI
ncbi:hypothetical protein [Roseateles amylovorans]|jgi:hypothetical protein|uniref:Uncharacterized protein n=1 Tax=Roseateles amylovorans TaxID=2978473 RepID=A0ABY6AV84_9BURK|nr:hypothetical protein [Roseateles amylovorans]UXH76917.1 hypothetical protein N4261_18045 [Roseateles amylovorans]